ncbi:MULTISPECIES: DUF2970 domain-containing protein [unclassified Herbaspirillum]|jgi:hypothetical protein|uniref:DUF2970 domain-containing protein n=1 Tax=unclassified Herbaspirillum TaxID=2624150 RepID=UPI000E2EB911|nr:MULTISPECIES: DUF2970 domain-containing protein [unclassified Herbaspirillum]RFB70952.1 DUF2970 domain-containing protein [Herbaspirillum sp. 3R-3a1]TFI08523.1 DUF2970 domain-containing protein [Herbaspirillum sp. 3R11]TFI14937.1 DUF2970 domain-containing protein [Herbaspirillum sp. 3R-11]TFI25808.1 DUF2970 domain-containing protein [Herbaspirillum sp. 3C11]
MSDLKDATQRKASFAATMKAVFWSFFGVRKRSDYESDAAKLNPLHVIIAGVIGAAIFVTVLVLIVKMVVGSAVSS